MGTAGKDLSASSNSATWLAGFALLAIVLLVTVVPGIISADAGHAGITLIGP
jgi:hypothetical protein